MNRLNVLVTGCGGDIGQSVGKILNDVDFVHSLYGRDISDKNAGKFIFQNFSTGLACSDSRYLTSLTKFIDENRIDILIPISEPELRFFAAQNISGTVGSAKLIMASDLALKTGFDKLETARFLNENSLLSPKTFPVSEVSDIDSFPVIVKSRTGSGSAQVHFVDDQESFDFIRSRNPEFIIQEYLADSLGEFTCGLFRDSKKEIRSIIFKRELTGGFSSYGEVIENKEIEQLLCSIATAFDLTGSINVQLRMTEKGPVVFEINPRFSSTVLFRHMLGFKDLIWSIEDALNLPIAPYESAPVGTKFFKGFSEYISSQDSA